ncbi:PDR/VanB family oxidoreductase [Neoaquamicrobium sediminum]|uniref:PDR/VanB family oxidoreductase n=1 Tax=Neoaquamicrobium sediminum TaxID=1849104 RepID=UPI00156351CF|nr:PDR/VanB family oxidoreductase [Mesorhizobium sediminum]NRC57228.1 oxidoreductase [Mesorhizobium sediminum]
MAVPTLQLKVARVRQETPDVTSFFLVHPDGRPLPSFAPGAHIDAHLADDLVRQYSLCNHPAETDHFHIAVKLEQNSRGGSKAMHEITVGSLLKIGTPRNNFPLSDEARSHVLLAGGIGITPLLSMARHLQRENESYRLEFFCRSIECTPFYEVISDELGAHAGFNIGLEPTAVRERLVSILRKRPQCAHLYICGPSAFITMATEIAKQNWPADCVHLEHFQPQHDLTQVNDRPFRVTLAQSNREFEIPSDKSILDILRQNHIPCDSSCREGVCGSCMVAVIEGEIDHRDSYLSDAEKEEGELMMICVSRAKGGHLIIDM